MNKIFIDCGANIGQSVRSFIEEWSDWDEYEIHSFEANPSLEKHFEKFKENPNFNFHKKAIWISDKGINFYLSTDCNWGSSIMKNKKTGELKKEPLLVESVDLSVWIKENFSKNDYIIVKMDIEGAEYDVLEKMISENTFDYINQIYIEFHASKVGLSKSNDNAILNKIKPYDTEVFCDHAIFKKY